MRGLTLQDKTSQMNSHPDCRTHSMEEIAKGLGHTTALLRVFFFECPKTLTISKWENTSVPSKRGEGRHLKVHRASSVP